MNGWEKQRANEPASERTIQGFKYQPCVYGQRQNDERWTKNNGSGFSVSQAINKRSICCCFLGLFFCSPIFFWRALFCSVFFYFGCAAVSRTFGWFTFCFSQMIKFYSTICLFVWMCACPFSIFFSLFLVCTIIKFLFKFCIVFNRVLLAKFGFFLFVPAWSQWTTKDAQFRPLIV